MSLKVIYKEQDIKSYKKKKDHLSICVLFWRLEPNVSSAHWVPSNKLGRVDMCVWGGDGRQQSPFPLSLVYFNLHSLIQQMPIE